MYFFTNHKYDGRIKNIYKGIKFENIESLRKKHFTKLVHKDLPQISIRTPHPRTIRTKLWENDFIKYVKTILENRSQ